MRKPHIVSSFDSLFRHPCNFLGWEHRDDVIDLGFCRRLTSGLAEAWNFVGASSKFIFRGFGGGWSTFSRQELHWFSTICDEFPQGTPKVDWVYPRSSNPSFQ